MKYIVTSENITIIDTNGNKTIATKGTPEHKIGINLIIKQEPAEKVYEAILNTILKAGYKIKEEKEKIELEYKGKPVPDEITTEIVEIAKTNKVVPEAYKLFLKKLDKIQDKITKKRLKLWIKNHGLAINNIGNIIAVKSVQEDGYSIHGNKNIKPIQGIANHKGQILYKEGEIIELKKSDCDTNNKNNCSTGLHCGAIEYLTSYYNGKRWFYIEVDPQDITSVPKDCNVTKIRSSKLKVLSEIKNKDKAEIRGVFDKNDITKYTKIKKLKIQNKNEEHPLVFDIIKKLKNGPKSTRAIQKNLRKKGITCNMILLLALNSDQLDVRPTHQQKPDSKRIISLKS